MDTISTHLHLTDEAYKLLDKYTGPRGRGQFISQLIVDYDRRQMDGDIAIAALREKAPQSSVPKEMPKSAPPVAQRRKKRR